jgi:hypothetical protein
MALEGGRAFTAENAECAEKDEDRATTPVPLCGLREPCGASFCPCFVAAPSLRALCGESYTLHRTEEIVV